MCEFHHVTFLYKKKEEILIRTLLNCDVSFKGQNNKLLFILKNLSFDLLQCEQKQTLCLSAEEGRSERRHRIKTT